MVFLLYFLNMVCSSGQSAFGKGYAAKGGKAAVFNINKALSGVIVFLIFGIVTGVSFHIPSLFFGLLYGVFLCISMCAGFEALKIGPMALTSIIASFSLVIPFVFGIIVLRENLSVYGIAGIMLLSLSIIILNFKKESGLSIKWSFYSILTMIANGICSLIQKYHQIYFPGEYRNEFMISALTSVLLILIVMLAIKHESKFKPSTKGFLAGAMNSASNYIVLYLAATENASVLFPMVSVTNVIAVWFIGKITFKETLRPLQMIGLLFGIASIILLKI